MSFTVHAVDPRLNWKTFETQYFYIHYAEGYEFLAQKTANIAEQVHKKLQVKIHWQPEEKTHFVISDETDSANGFATPLSFNRSVLFMAPPQSATSLEDFDDWLETLITHEYTHILHLDKVSGGASTLRNVFGRTFLFFPNIFQPNWLVEGLSTYYETDMEKGIGRGQSSLFNMMMRSDVEQGIKSVSQINIPNRSWPMGTVSYLYGVHFYQYIEETYGHQGIENLIENYSDNIIPFMINANANTILNKDISELWKEYSDWLVQRYQNENILCKNEKVEGTKITNTGYDTSSLDISADTDENIKDDAVYFVLNSAYEHAALMHHVNDQTHLVTEVHRGAKINTHPRAGVLIIQNEFCDEYNINSDLYVLANGKKELERITQCGRYRSASWSSDGQSIIAVKTMKGESQLVQLNLQGEMKKILWTGNHTDIVTQLKSSPTGKYIVAAVFREDAGWNIEEFNLNSLKWNFITNNQAIDMYPSYSEDGKNILYSSEATGKYQIYRFQKENAEVVQLTKVSSGAFGSVQKNSRSPLYYVGYHAGGRDIYKLNEVNKLSTVLPVGEINNSIHITHIPDIERSIEKDYSALSSLRPRGWLPFLSLNDDRREYGFTTNGNDALGIHNYEMTLAYDMENKWLVGDFQYAYANRFSMGYRRSTDIVKDTSGDFAVSRNIDDIFFSIKFNDRAIEQNIQYRLGLTLNESRDGNRAENIPQLREIKDNLVGGAILFRNAKNYIRSISPGDGRNVRFQAETTEFFESDFSGEIFTLDWREYLSLGNQNILAVRFVQGWGTDQPRPFRLGGENNEIDLLDFINPTSESVFNKRHYALRGYAEGLPQLRGRRMQIGTLEYRFPGDLIERSLMSPPIGIVQWSGNLFTETGAVYEKNSADKYYTSIGAELQGEINLFYGITSRMRLGYAHGFDNEIGEDRIYFSLGSSF